MKFRRIITKLITAFGIATVLMLGTAPAFITPAQAADCSTDLSITGGINCAAPAGASQNNLFGNGSLFQSISNTLIFVIGAISVIMVIIGGLRYVLSTGNPTATSGAKDQILYAIIGVVVAILAFAIVNFVIIRIK